MELKSTMQYFNEYLFHELVDGVNAKRKKNNDPVIPVSRARFLHDEMFANLDITKVGPTAFIKAANDLFAKEANMDTVLDKDAYNEYVEAFKNLTGIGAKQRPAFPVLPLSPYDKRFAGRSIFMQNSSRLLFAKGQDVDTFGEEFSEDVTLYGSTPAGYRKVGNAQTKDDISGVARLIPYMTQKEYTDIAPWINAIGADDPSKYMSDEAVDRACGLLSYLQNNGIEYTVARDMKQGQVRAMLTGTKISIRLTDSHENEQYIGRVYDNGSVIYYTTDKTMPKSRKTYPFTHATLDDCIKLIQFARGESITKRDSDTPAGLVKRYNESFTKNGSVIKTRKIRNEAYHSGRNYSEVVGSYPNDSTSHILLHVDNDRRTTAIKFQDAATATMFLQDAVTSARDNFVDAVGVDTLIEDAKKHAGDADYEPNFSGDMTIAAIQRNYWDVLTGKQNTLLRPDVTLDDYKERLAEITDVDITDTTFRDKMLSDMIYTGSAEEQVRQHMLDNIECMIGTFEPTDSDYATGKRFDPVNVAVYMTSESNRYKNSDDIISALRAADIPADELRGDTFYNQNVKNKLIKFDRTTARPMSTIANPFVHNMYETIKSTLSETGCTVNDRDILMDDNGIVHYTAERVDVVRVREDGTSSKPITGEIGQIFVPDDMGLVETKFAGSENYLFTPGYEAYVVPQKYGETKTMEERTRLRGYEQLMSDSIRYQLRSDVLLNSDEAGSPTSVNNVYKKLYDTRYSLDLLERARQDKMSDDLLHAIIKTNASRVRYSNEFKENSTINADFQAGMQGDNYYDEMNDNFSDYYSLTGHRNMSIMTHEGDGYFDSSATGTSTNQGITRYLVESAVVNPDGTITRGKLDDKTSLMKTDVCKYMDYVPFDRRQMTFNNLLKASCVTDKVNTAQMTFGGWTFDDGYVVSKEFADKYQIRDSEGKMRSLIKGDKISDMNGNKGVIGLVVDRNMSPEDAKAQNLEQEVAWFKANPELDVVGAPFPAPSRFNGGSARELMLNPKDLVGPDGKVHDGCMGETHYIVTHMAVDEKTHIYDDEALAQGKGRKASAQLAWALASQNATAVLSELYHTNSSATANLREMLITMGLDMDELGTLRVGYQAQLDEKRAVFEIPELQYKEMSLKSGKELRLDMPKMKRDFSNVISQAGGFLAVPFELKYPTGEKLMELEIEDGDEEIISVEEHKVHFVKKSWMQRDRDGVVREHFRNVDLLANGGSRGGSKESVEQKPKYKSYALPVLSSYLRSGQEFADGTSSVHDYTNHYIKVYEASILYLDAQKRGDKVAMATAQATAQDAYDKITNDLKERKFSGKHNYFRDNIMANKLTHSATAVWTADPRLDIDQIAMNSEMAEKLDVTENGYILTWRDPVLRDAGVRYMRVKIDDSLTGVSINPAMDKSFDGDFDGDSIGMKKLETKAAQREAMEKLSVNANLLDLDVGKTGEHELMMQDSLDMKSAEYARPELAERRVAITKEVNEYESSAMDKRMLSKARRKTVAELSEYTRDTFSHEYGTDMISFKDMPSHMGSVEHMVIDGAKGSYGKLKSYAKYIGVEYDMTDDGHIDLSSVKDMKHSLATRKDDEDVEYATAVKAFGTGVAGMYSQRGISVLRNASPKEILAMTYPVTQSILQSKHDPIEARHKYEMLMGTCRDLWRGVKMSRHDNEDGVYWLVDKDDNGHTMQATREEFIDQFKDIYTHPDGLNIEINPEYVDVIADKLVDDSGFMMNIEREAKDEKAAIMDKLAYGGTFETLMDGAREQRNLFEGKYNAFFAPASIKYNMQCADKADRKIIQKSDTKDGYKPKTKGSKNAAVSVPRTKEVSTVTIAATGTADGVSPDF